MNLTNIMNLDPNALQPINQDPYSVLFRIASEQFPQKLVQVLSTFAWILLIFNVFCMIFGEKLVKLAQKNHVFSDPNIVYSIYFGLNCSVVIFMVIILSRL